MSPSRFVKVLMQGMDFIQGRVRFEKGDTQSVVLIAELLEVLNLCSRRAFSQSISQNVPPKSLTELWALKAGYFGASALTAHQKKMVSRHAANLRKAANARSEYLAGHLKELAEACSKMIAKKRADLAGIKKELKAIDGFGKPLLKPETLKRKRERARLIQQGIDRSEGRAQRLLSASSRHAALAKSGLASTCFGSQKLASQAHALDSSESPFKSKADWDKAWSEARNGSWLFEGSKSAPSANPEVKWDPETGKLRIRLAEDQALARIEAYAKKQGLALTDVLHGPAGTFGSIRKKCDYLEAPLSFEGQGKSERNSSKP